MNWANKRRIIYALSIFFIVIFAGIYVFRDIIFPTATCHDAKQNGYESGVDCGGLCSLRCTQEVIPLSVAWARAIPTSSSTYDLAALISNKNIDNAPKVVEYTFIAYDEGGLEIYKNSGISIVPIDGDFPIVVQSVTLAKKPTHVSATLKGNVPHYKVLEKSASPTLRVTNSRYEADSIPRVYATITNTKRIVLRTIPIRALLFDADGNVYAVGQTVIPQLNKEETQEIVFTWDQELPVPPTKIRIYPILDPFLGSL